MSDGPYPGLVTRGLAFFADLLHFARYVEAEAHAHRMDGGRWRAFNRTMQAGAFPIGIDVEEFEALWHHLRRHACDACEISIGPSEVFYVQERVARVDDERCGLHGLGGDSRRPRAHGEYNVDWNLH